MSSAATFRILTVGVDPTADAALRAALARRGAAPDGACATPAAARDLAAAPPGGPCLFVVQLSADRSAAAIETLAQPGNAVLGLLPPGAGLPLILAAQRAGAEQLVPLPLPEDDFLDAFDRLAAKFAPAEQAARVIAVCGVTGGCGATTVALNVAYELAAGRKSVILVELARQMGSLASYLDVEPFTTTHDLLADPARLTAAGVRQAVHEISPKLGVLVGPFRDITPGVVPARHVFALVEHCRRHAAVVVLDVPCTFDEYQFEALAQADQVVLVGVQSIASVRTLKVVRDTLRREEGLSDQMLVINRYDPTLPGFGEAELARHLGVPRVLTVANDYPSVMASLTHVQPLHKAAPHSRVVADLRAVAQAVGGSAPPSDASDRLGRALRTPASTTVSARPLRVLHVEDDPVQQQALALHLEAVKSFDCQVTPVADEESAVAACRAKRYDLVFLDYHLAHGNGLACLCRLRRLDAELPIVVLSGMTDPQTAAALVEAGADDFLGKENLCGDVLRAVVAASVARSDLIRARQSGLVADPPASKDLRGLSRAEANEIIRLLAEVHAVVRERPVSAAGVQRLADVACAEMVKAGVGPGDVPRRALLGAFLRMFSTGEAVEDAAEG